MSASWPATTVYQIYPRSFRDANGDGVGDLAGILEKLDYLRDLGVETLWISPFYRSPQRDFGYDIADYLAFDPAYGTPADLERLIAAAHARGLRIVLDMVLNHTSDEHAWFREARQGRDAPHRDFYIWRKGRVPGPPARGGRPPNNWRSMVGPRGWQYDEASDEWYYASFFPFQPDLNYRNPAVKAAMFDVVRHYLRMGVDGFRLDIVCAIFKDPAFRDNPPSLRPLPAEDNPDGFFQSTRHTVNHPDAFTFVKDLREVVDEFEDRFLVGEVFGSPSLLRKYCEPSASGRPGLHAVFLFKAMRTAFSAPAFRALVAELEREFPEPLIPTYVFGNHDRPRSGAKLNDDPRKLKLLAALQLTARGIPFIYYGEEIGMANADLPLRTGLDELARRYRWVPQPLVPLLRRNGLVLNRDECRTPMQWTGAPGAGFTAPGVEPWLPVNPDAATRNVAAQALDPDSILACYRRLLAARKQSAALRHGALVPLAQPKAAARHVFAYDRIAGGETVRVLLNFSRKAQAPGVATEGWAPLVSTHAAPPEDLGTLRPYEGRVLHRPEAQRSPSSAPLAF